MIEPRSRPYCCEALELMSTNLGACTNTLRRGKDTEGLDTNWEHF